MDKGGEVVSIADSVAVDKHIKGGGDSVSFMELIVAKNIEAGKEIIPGMYVVKDSLVTINPDGSVTPGIIKFLRRVKWLPCLMSV